MANEVETIKSSLLDTNFGSGGVATAGITADPTYRCGMAIDAEGNIVVAGTAGFPDPTDSSTTYDEFAIVRFAADGWLDSTFGNNGVVLDASGPGNYNYATAVAISSPLPPGEGQGEGNDIIVAGRSTGYGLDLVRYLPGGTEDPNFQNWNASGLTAAAVNSVVIQPNNMILVGGSFGSDGKFGVARFNVDGTLNTTFNSGYGFVTNGTAGSAADGLVIQPDGSVIAAGASESSPLLARLTAGDIGGAEVNVYGSGASLALTGDSYVAAGDTYTLTLGDGLMNLGSGTDVSYTINWNDGTDPTTITADDLAAAGDQVTHDFPGMTSGNTVTISVDVNVGSISGADTTFTTYTGVGSLTVTVDSITATTTVVSLTNGAANLGDTAQLQAAVTADVTELGITTGGVEFYEQVGTGATAALIDLGAGTLESPDVFVLRTPPLAAGDNNFIAVFSGDGFYQPSTSAALTVSIAGADDTLSIGGPSCAIAEGTDVSLSLPNDPYGNAITQWTINWGDGAPLDASSHAYGAPGTYTVIALGQSSAGYFEGITTVTVSSTAAGSAPSDVNVTVDNAEYSGADTEDGGSLAPDQLHVSFNGPAAAESYNVSIDWGDGSAATTFSLDPGQTSVTNPDEAGFDYPLQQYAANGTYGIIVTVTDAENNSASNSSTPFDVTYSNSAPLNLTLSLDQSTVSAGSGEPNLSGSFTDPQPNIPHVVTVEWGDGTDDSPDITTVVLAAGQVTFTAQPNSNTYATAGDYTITATVAGMDGSTTASTSVIVTAVPPDVMIGATQPMASEYFGTSEPPAENPYDGAFSVTCGGGSAGNVTVSFSLSGAVYGAAPYDYTLSCSEAVITASPPTELSPGRSSCPATAPPRPLSTRHPERPRALSAASGKSDTVTMTLTSSTAYNVVSGWTTATATVYYDYPWNSENPTTETRVTMVPFNPDGSQADPATTFTAPVGDFIPIGLGTLIAVSNPSTVWGILTYDESEFSVTDPNGDYIPSGEEISLAPAETIIDVSVNSSNTALTGLEVDDDITFQGGQFSSASLNMCSLNLDFKPLQMYNNGTQIAGSALQNLKIGQLINLQVQDPSGRGGIVAWSMPSGTTVKRYQPTAGSNGLPALRSPIHVSSADLYALALGTSLSQQTLSLGTNGSQNSPSLSFAWVTPEGVIPVSTNVETAVVSSPFGQSTSQAAFKTMPLTGVVQYSRQIAITDMVISTGNGDIDVNTTSEIEKKLRKEFTSYALKYFTDLLDVELGPLKAIPKYALPSMVFAKFFLTGIKFKLTFTLSVRTKKYHWDNGLIVGMDDNWSAPSTFSSSSIELSYLFNADGGNGVLISDFTGLSATLKKVVPDFRNWLKNDVAPAVARAKQYYRSLGYEYGGDF